MSKKPPKSQQSSTKDAIKESDNFTPTSRRQSFSGTTKTLHPISKADWTTEIFNAFMALTACDPNLMKSEMTDEAGRKVIERIRKILNEVYKENVSFEQVSINLKKLQSICRSIIQIPTKFEGKNSKGENLSKVKPPYYAKDNFMKDRLERVLDEKKDVKNGQTSFSKGNYEELDGEYRYNGYLEGDVDDIQVLESSKVKKENSD